MKWIGRSNCVDGDSVYAHQHAAATRRMFGGVSEPMAVFRFQPFLSPAAGTDYLQCQGLKNKLRTIVFQGTLRQTHQHFVLLWVARQILF